MVVIILTIFILSNLNSALADANYNLQYDANGNLINGFDYNYEYNEFNQLKKVKDSNNNLIEEYWYDHEGSRLKKYNYIINETTYYVNDYFIQTRNDTGVYNETYYYDKEKPLYTIIHLK